MLAPSLGAHPLIQKFCCRSTFFREQRKLKAAHGIDLTRNLMCSWHGHLAGRLLPLYQTIAKRIRPAKLGHKNWMFIGREHIGWRSAVIDTFVEQIRRHGADPF